MAWDVLVVGAGIAGLSAAHAAVAAGAGRVAVVTNRPIGEGGCISKVHGINVGFTESEQEAHCRESIASSKGLADPALVEVLCTEIGTRIKHLEAQGLRFQMTDEGYALGRYGGCNEPRALNCLDFTGRELANTLGRAALEAGCWVMDDLTLVSLLTNDGECVGVLGYSERQQTMIPIFARAVVLACGGGLASVRPSTNPSEKFLAGISAAARAGASVLDVELTQFHPTGLWRGSAATSGEIIEEELRNLGGVLLNSSGDRFAHKYTPLREMATRDVVARAIALEVHSGNGIDGNHVLLDLTAIDRDLLAQRFPYTTHRLRLAGHDMLHSRSLPVYPASHFILGGIRIDTGGASTIPYLYACGEDAGGVHGANRLGGNGVAESLVFGHRAGCSAARHAGRKLPSAGVAAAVPHGPREDVPSLGDVLGLGRSLGPVRHGIQLQGSLSEIQTMLNSFVVESDEVFKVGESLAVNDAECVELWQRLQGLNLLTLSAIARDESVGPHHRLDARPSPECEDAQATTGRHTVIGYVSHDYVVSWPAPLPELTADIAA